MIPRPLPWSSPILAMLAAFLSCIPGTARSQTPVADCKERMLTHVRQLPDCEFNFVVSRRDLAERPVVITHQGDRVAADLYHFSHYKGRFFIKTVAREHALTSSDTTSAYGEQLAYDGVNYYRFDNRILTCGKNFEDPRIKDPFVARFADHPLFALYFDGIFSGRNANFALPFLTKETTWSDALFRAKPIAPALPEYQASVETGFPGQSRVFHMTPNEPFPIECVADHLLKPANKIVTRVKAGNKFVTGLHSRYAIPELIERNIVDTDGKAHELDRLGVAMASFKLISTAPGLDVYQIPRHLAKTVIDLDLPHPSEPAYDLVVGARFTGVGALQHLSSTIVGIATLTDGAKSLVKSMSFKHVGSRTTSKADLRDILRRDGVPVKGIVTFEVVASEPALQHSRSRMGSWSYLKTDFNLKVTSDTNGEVDLDALFPELKLGIREISPGHPITASVQRSRHAGRPLARRPGIAITIREEGSALWSIDEGSLVDDAEALLALTRHFAEPSSAVLYHTSKMDRAEVLPDIVDQLAKAVISQGSQFYVHHARGRSGTGITVHRVVVDDASGALERRPATREELMQLDMQDTNTSPEPPSPRLENK